MQTEVSAALPVGARYEVRNAQNYFGTPVASGTYKGGAIAIPTGNTSVAAPIGLGSKPASTAPEYNVFILRMTAAPRTAVALPAY